MAFKTTFIIFNKPTISEIFDWAADARKMAFSYSRLC
jgi:hypothetical protein